MLGLSEGDASSYTVTLKVDGAALALARIDAATLTVKNRFTDKIVNYREGQDILNANNVTIHATSGLLTWSIQAADAVRLTTRTVDEHIAEFTVTYDTTETLSWNETLLVRADNESSSGAGTALAGGTVSGSIQSVLEIGDQNTDGSWRIIIVSGNLETQKRDGGVWVTTRTEVLE